MTERLALSNDRENLRNFMDMVRESRSQQLFAIARQLSAEKNKLDPKHEDYALKYEILLAKEKFVQGKIAELELIEVLKS